jgi:Tfp pilus assembly protein PilV
MSLTEVLVALFILTIGVIGILTMFPLGAAQMARAVRDDRSALAAENVRSILSAATVWTQFSGRAVR